MYLIYLPVFGTIVPFLCLSGSWLMSSMALVGWVTVLVGFSTGICSIQQSHRNTWVLVYAFWPYEVSYLLCRQVEFCFISFGGVIFGVSIPSEKSLMEWLSSSHFCFV